MAAWPTSCSSISAIDQALRLYRLSIIQRAWMMPGTKPMIVSTMFRKKWKEKPTCRKTPTGGRTIASMILSMSNFRSLEA